MLDNGWVDVNFNDTSIRLNKAGYSVGGYVDDDKVTKYVLYRATTDKFERVHEFDSIEELNNMIKLLLPPED
jgi:hypothetical protein